MAATLLPSPCHNHTTSALGMHDSTANILRCGSIGSYDRCIGSKPGVSGPVHPTHRLNWTISGVHDIVILMRFNIEPPPRTTIGADGLIGHGRVGSRGNRYLLFMLRSRGREVLIVRVYAGHLQMDGCRCQGARWCVEGVEGASRSGMRQWIG